MVPRPHHCSLGGGILLPSLYADARYIDERHCFTGHSLGLKVGWYENGCKCAEKKDDPLNYAGDVQSLAAFGFDGIKLVRQPCIRLEYIVLHLWGGVLLCRCAMYLCASICVPVSSHLCAAYPCASQLAPIQWLQSFGMGFGSNAVAFPRWLYRQPVQSSGRLWCPKELDALRRADAEDGAQLFHREPQEA